MKIDEIMFSDRELALMPTKKKKEPSPVHDEPDEIVPAKPPRGLTAKEKQIWLQKQKEAADRAAFRKFEKERKAALNTPEEKAKRRQAQIDADLKKLSSPGRTKATDPAHERELVKKRPAKKTLNQKDINYYTKVAHDLDSKID